MKNPFSSKHYPYWTGQPVKDTYSCLHATPHMAGNCPDPIPDGDVDYRLSQMLLPHITWKADLGEIIPQIKRLFELQ